ncbi:MAG TPA: hypothetical protein VMS75_10980 [Terriglobales bacterium]|nr:hypothetical protein [Terriglobales bacterium]
MKPDKVDRRIVTAFVLVLWVVAAWLLYPLVILDRVDTANVKTFLYRSVLGLTLLIVFFGKTLFDLVYPWVVGRKIPRRDAALLTLYLLALTLGIIFMVVRLVLVYMKSSRSGGGVIF